MSLDPSVLEREIEKRRKRALSLGVDTLVTRIYYEHGFRNYSLVHASGMKPIFPAVTDAVERERDRLDFRIDGRPYAIRARERSYSGREGTEIEVFRGEQIVFSAILDRRKGGTYGTRRVTGFIEGNWIRDFERIDQDATEYRHHRHEADLAAGVAEKAKRFGINPTTANGRPSLLARILDAIRHGLLRRSA